MFSTAVRMLSLPLNEAEAKIAVVFFLPFLTLGWEKKKVGVIRIETPDRMTENTRSLLEV